MDVQKAYSLLEVKAVDATKRTFSGICTTPTMDRVGDVINPLGAKFTNPLVLLHQHRHDEPIGTVRLQKPTAKGIGFEAEIPNVDRPGLFKDRVDMAYDEISYGVVRAVSIGFRPIKYAFTDEGVDYQEIEIYEVSTVSIPALPDAIIAQVKSLNGAPLPRELVRSIQEADSRGDGSIKLLRPHSLVSGIKLTK
jgi:HK97 family phage prohead protease